MEIEIKEEKVLIAVRIIGKGDTWQLHKDYREKNENHPSLTEALEAYFQVTKFNKAFYLDPIGGKLYSVDRIEIEKEIKPPKEYSFYGDLKQGL